MEKRTLIKMWNKPLHTFKDGTCPIFKEIDKDIFDRYEMIQYLHEKRDEILNIVPAPNANNKNEVEEYKKTLLNHMIDIIKKEYPKIKEEDDKEEEEYFESVKHFGGSLEDLRKNLDQYIDEIEAFKSEWGGAGVIVSNDPDRPCHDRDILLILNYHSNPIAWLMHKVRDIIPSPINYSNKYTIYSRIAMEAKEYIEKYNEPKDIYEWVELLKILISQLIINRKIK